MNASSWLKSQLHFVIGNVQHWNHYGESASETLTCCPKLITHYFKVNFPYYRNYKVQKTWNNDNNNNLAKWSKCFKTKAQRVMILKRSSSFGAFKDGTIFPCNYLKSHFLPNKSEIEKTKMIICIKNPNPSIMWEFEHWLRINYTHVKTIDHKNNRTLRILNMYSWMTHSYK